jgi:hypothetical protein
MARWTIKPLIFALALGGYLLLLGTLAAGFQLVIGRVSPESGIVYKVVGAGLVVAGSAVFAATIQRWSKYFFAFCLLAALRALFAFLVGHTLSRLVVDRMHAAEFFGSLVAMVFLSYQYANRPPRTILESVALVAAVVG